MCAGVAIFSIRSARAERPWRRSKQKWEACFSPPNISNSRCRSKARRSWFPAYDALPAGSWETRIVQSWDVAMMTSGRNDYSACSTWLVHKSDAYLVHVYRGRLEYPDLRRKVSSLAAEHRATTILIEDAGPGMNLLQDLRATMPGGMTRT